MQRDRRFTAAVVAAGLIHAVFLLLQPAAHHVPKMPRADLLREPLVGVELALSLPSELSQASGHTGPPTTAESAAAVAATHRASAPVGHEDAAPDSTGTSESQALLGADENTSESVATHNGSTTGQLAPPAGGAKRLPLRKQSIGNDFGLAYALSNNEPALRPGADAEDRLRRSMQQEIASKDRELGIHVPAPLILALESAAREVAIPTNSIATFVANFDGSGRLLSLEYAGSNHASPQWTRLSERVEQALRGTRLDIAKNTKGVDFKLRLESRAQLPSGHDPGLGVDVLGLPVKKGEGKRSSKITLLDPLPKVVEVEIPGHPEEEKIKLPVLQLTLLGIAGDPADIGAPTRQIVRVQVLDEKIY